MSNNFQKALSIIRDQAKTEVAKGNAFEKLCKIFFENDDIQKQQYSKVWHYKDWAKENPSFSQTDIGIDIVAELKDGSGLTAIQCKCYDSEYSVTKEDIDSFISASNNEIFKRLILIDTSSNEIGANAQSVINNLNKDYIRIQTAELEQSRIDWLTFIKEDKVILADKKEPLDHQIKAIKAAEEYYKGSDRGKMIMACGTGKTYTSLRITEKIAGKGKFILYMVPSLALMSQSIREWKNDCVDDFEAFSACSDKKVGKKKAADDEIIVNLTDLAFPATTDPKKLAEQIESADQSKMIVVFSTYQSIDVISKAQKEHKLRNFDLILCDEAHRTTGATLTGEDESYFVQIHNDENIKGNKRLYMTATPRIYGEKAKKKADEGQAELASMDDKEVYGSTFYTFGFNKAVENNLLTDYKVVILAVDEDKVNETLQKSFEEGSELKLDDATKIIGCYKALAKVGFQSQKLKDQKIRPIKRALAFTQNINISKIFQHEFKNVVEDFVKNEKNNKENNIDLNIQVEHIDGSFPADKRNERLNWLKEDTPSNNCRILTNVKCLSEGVDVPTLDAIMFLHPRKSQIDVVQSVGRVMRKAQFKDLGYVIIPITVAPGVSPERALNNNEKYKVVWQILNALRSHDERMDSAINKISIGEDISDKIEIIDLNPELKNITSTVEDIKPKSKNKKEDDNVIGLSDDNVEDVSEKDQDQFEFEIGDLSRAIKAKIVEKCGTRDYWENWAKDISEIAQTHIKRLNAILIKKNSSQRIAFEKFLEELRDDLNPDISENDAVEMLAQHIITKPVFDTLFQGNEFTKDNSVSRALEKIISKIYETNLNKETETLNKFYESVKRRSKDIITSKGRTTLINELYERFFKNAFPLTTSKLGIVYTPTEVVDFIIQSIEDILKNDFKSSFNNKNVHILDPFTGTGTFISRLLESNIIEKSNLEYKYKNEIHCNEMVLLAYYIAGINIESIYHEIKKPNNYVPFNGAVLTDTFQLYEQERDMIAELLPDNSLKRTNQKKREVKVIMSNPPYSVGQGSVNDNAANVKYNNLDEKIKNTYAKYSTAQSKTSLYDSYIRAFRWASDRIGDNGVIGFVNNAGWLDSNAADGLRKVLLDEFQKIYVLNLRGNARTAGEIRRKEAGNIFGAGTRTPITINFFIKNNKNNKSEIKYFDIGDYLDQKEKLKKIIKLQSIGKMESSNVFSIITPDNKNDWINKGNPIYDNYLRLGNKSKSEISIFNDYTGGIKTSRDSWNYNFSLKKLKINIKKTIDFFNSEVERFNKSKISKSKKISDFVNNDPTLISWDRDLLKKVQKNQKIKIYDNQFQLCLYRPFTKMHVYRHISFNDQIYKYNSIYPNNTFDNLSIGLSGAGSNEFSVLMTDLIADYGCLSPSQYFPIKIYEKNDEMTLFASNENSVHGISDDILKIFKDNFKNNKISKDQIFYFVYGFLHNRDYREMFKSNLSKELAKIPLLKNYELFDQYCIAGKKLSELHVNFENVEKYNLEILTNNDQTKNNYKVKKMKLIKGTENAKIVFNENITINNIPIKTFDYKVNGKSPLEWVVERQGVFKHKATNIINDCNDYADETVKNDKYSLELIQRVVTVSIETTKIINSLPKIKFD